MKTVTQTELQQFVNREVLLSQSILIDHLFSENIFSWEDITNYEQKICSDCGNNNIYSKMHEDLNTNDLIEKYTCSFCDLTFTDSAFDNLDTETREIFEWYAVTDFLAEKLENAGEPILKNDYGTWWGRTTSGQAIVMDSVIEKIYSSL